MSEEIIFLDTYAIYEIIKGNEKFSKYSKMHGITTIFNLAELNYNLKKEIDKEPADAMTNYYASLATEVSIEDIKEAMDLKTRKRSLSIPDAIGYVVARKHKVKFLTGDKEFEKMSNVEFVKK